MKNKSNKPTYIKIFFYISTIILSFVFGAILSYVVFFFEGNMRLSFYRGQIDVIKQMSVLDLQKSNLIKQQEIKK